MMYSCPPHGKSPNVSKVADDPTQDMTKRDRRSYDNGHLPAKPLGGGFTGSPVINHMATCHAALIQAYAASNRPRRARACPAEQPQEPEHKRWPPGCCRGKRRYH